MIIDDKEENSKTNIFKIRLKRNMEYKIETIKSYLKILLSLIKLENKLSLIQALKINTVWRVTRLQSKICKRVTTLYLSKGRVTGLQEGKDYKSLSEGKGYIGP